MCWPTLLSLLTDEYKMRMVQEAYHDAHTNAPQWPVQDRWPEGFMRRWHYHAVTNQPHSVIVTPTLVQFLAGDADNFITNIHTESSGRSAESGEPRCMHAVFVDTDRSAPYRVPSRQHQVSLGCGETPEGRVLCAESSGPWQCWLGSA